MGISTLENAIKKHVSERETKGQIDWVPLDIYNCLEETIPHGLVIQLGELILKLKGVGNNNL